MIGVAGVNAHRIEVFDRADDDDVVLQVAHDLELELFPADDGFFDQDRVHRAQIQPALNDALQILRC